MRALLRAPVGVPPTPGRQTAQRWAREELSDPAYARARPSLWQRAADWLQQHLERIASSTGLGAGQLVALVAVLTLVVVVVVVLARRQVRFGLARAAGPAGDVLGASQLTGEQHRRQAEQALGQGRYADAVRESMRAIARRLDERTLLDPRPGRTADELAREAAALLPDRSAALARAARTFDDVAYGGVPATLEAAQGLAALDREIELTTVRVPVGLPR